MRTQSPILTTLTGVVEPCISRRDGTGAIGFLLLWGGIKPAGIRLPTHGTAGKFPIRPGFVRGMSRWGWAQCDCTAGYEGRAMVG